MTLPGSGCRDITYIPVKNGFLYLVAIMDWATRKILTWRPSNTFPSRQIALQSPAGQRTAFKRNGSSIIGLGSTTQSVFTRPLISERQTSHTLATRRNEKRHEHTTDASYTNGRIK
jgi:hypothetical protein